MKTTLENKLKALVAQRDEIVKDMEQLKAAYEARRDQLIAINGSIATVDELYNNLGDDTYDTEGKAASGADSN